MTDKPKTNTISLAIFDDMCQIDGNSAEYQGGADDYKAILEKLQVMLEPYREQPDEAGYFDDDFFSDPRYMENIAWSLAESGQFVVNRYQKYYVVAFAINHKRFPIFSKDCDTEMIKWSRDDEDIPCVNPDPNNVNPVEALLVAIHGTKDK